MLSVVIPTFNAEKRLGRALTALVGPAVRGCVREVIVVDGGSRDGTLSIVDTAGTKLLKTVCNRGVQLKAGADAAQSDWLLFLRADTVLDPGWDDEVSRFIERVERDYFGTRDMAAVFSFRLDHFSRRARILEILGSLRCFLFSLPSGDQGLLIPRSFYAKLGGHAPLPVMEDVELIRRIRRRRLIKLRAHAVSSAEHYEREGFVARALRNLCLVTLYFMRVPPSLLARLEAKHVHPA